MPETYTRPIDTVFSMSSWCLLQRLDQLGDGCRSPALELMMEDSYLDFSPAPSVTSSLTNNFSGVLTESSRMLTTTSTSTSTSEAPPKQTCPPTSFSSSKIGLGQIRIHQVQRKY
ncbi:uncharacterized protein LOC143239732 isoform X1 [Tachypleus tridentatus]|uniref:uncharacterized protein LOC143239732 isoform X1 n=1 Tax=Tachypleus tridentatus TaxID=6853 RepID=UPI003FD5CA24